MRFSAPARQILAAALLLTLGAKAAWTRRAPVPDAGLFAARVEAHLQAGGFETRRLRRPFGNLIFARDADCRMMVSDYRPHGTLADALTSYGRAVVPLHYVWRGDRCEAAPKLLPLTEFFMERELRRLGFSPQRHPILAVAASEGCRADRIDWTPLASLPR